MIGKPLYLDFSGDPPDPDWIVEGMIERGTLTVLAAAQGAGKSFLSASLTVCLLQGRKWLGRVTNGTKVLYIDGENLPRIVQWRLHGLGMTNDDRSNLRYFLRQGVRIGEGEWLEKVEREIETFKPDVVILDTASSVLAMKSGNDNTEVATVMGQLRGLCNDCAVILIHHERKSSSDSEKPRDAGAALLGGMQWAGQADSHFAVSKMGKVKRKETADGGHEKKYCMKIEVPKNRDGDDQSEEWAIVSVHDASGKPIETRIVRV